MAIRYLYDPLGLDFPAAPRAPVSDPLGLDMPPAVDAWWRVRSPNDISQVDDWPAPASGNVVATAVSRPMTAAPPMTRSTDRSAGTSTLYQPAGFRLPWESAPAADGSMLALAGVAALALAFVVLR